MAFALRDFQYFDREQGRSIVVKQGQQVDGDLLARHKCNIEKLERTKFVAIGDAPNDFNDTGLPERNKKRGRPKKTK